jgi:hypothetical protein
MYRTNSSVRSKSGVSRFARRDGGVRTSSPGPVDQAGRGRVEVRLRPRRAHPPGAGPPLDEVVQHAAIAQDDEPLIEPIAIRRGVVENLLAPAVDHRRDLSAQHRDGNRIHQRGRGRASQLDAALPHDPPNQRGVAVLGLDERLAAVVEIPERRTGASMVPEHCGREVRALEVLRPFARETIGARVDDLKGSYLLVRELIAHGDDEVDVAVLVEFADGERPLEVGADERVAECRANVVYENAEDVVELRIRCGVLGATSEHGMLSTERLTRRQ